MERHVDTRQGNGSKASLKLDIAFGLLLLLSLFVARFDYVAEHLLHFFNRICLRQLGKNKSWNQCELRNYTDLGDVNLLNLDKVQDVSHGLKGNKLPSADVLLALEGSVST